MPRLVLRADGGDGRGIGHVVRSLALADAWAAAGGEALLAVNAAVAERATTLDPGRGIVAVDAPVGSADDAATVRALLDGASWLALDGYLFGPDFAVRAGAAEDRTLLIDDHGHAPSHPAAVVLDQNPGVTAEVYDDRPAGSTLLLGPRYALLRPAAAPVERQHDLAPRRLLVALGGDPGVRLVDVISQTLDRLGHRPDVAIEVIGGGDLSPLADRPGVTVHGFVTDAHRHLVAADIALVAAGTISWDLCRHHLPSVVVATVDNQEPVVAALVDAGAALRGEIDDPAANAALVARLLEDADLRLALAEAAGALVDGRGASRAVAALRSRSVRLRPAVAADVDQLWAWANDPVVRGAAFDSSPIPREDHEVWFADRLRDPRTRIFLAESERGTVWGQFRVDLDGDGLGTIDVSVDTDHRGLGLAASLIRAGVREVVADLPGLEGLRAEVLVANERSAAAFSTAGLDPAGADAGVMTFTGRPDHVW